MIGLWTKFKIIRECQSRTKKTLEDKTIIYQANTIKGNKPINIGHSYSVLTALPEREETGELPWAIPLMVERVKSSETGKQVGSRQLNQILTQKNLPWFNHWSVVVVDSDYSAKTFLREQSQHSNLVVVTTGATPAQISKESKEKII